MIKLFHIPTHQVDTSKFDNQTRGSVVDEFEERFAEYVGAKYAVSFDSATSGIFLTFNFDDRLFRIPSLLPPVVGNALRLACNTITFEDNVDWVGHPYILYEWSDCVFIDSAQHVHRNQYESMKRSDKDLMLFSFYPTKPVSGADGGMIVSNDKESIDGLRVLSNNGMQNVQTAQSWERVQVSLGHKMYMRSFQAYIAMENLKVLDTKREELANVRNWYNYEFGLKNTSDHLYRVRVTNNLEFVKKAKAAGIECGIHYAALHKNDLFEYEGPELPLSERDAETMVSIPFHEKLTSPEIEAVIKFVNKNR